MFRTKRFRSVPKKNNLWIKYILKAAILSSLFATPAQAENACFAPFSKTDICDFAKTIQSNVAPTLPMQISKNLSVRNIVALGPMLQLTVMLGYDEQTLNQSLQKSGVSRSTIDQKLVAMTKNLICSSEQTEAFLGLGGKITYFYHFLNGKNYTQISVTKDDC